MSHLYAEEENGTTEVETEADVEVVSAQGAEVVLQGGPTEESAGVVVKESTGAGSHGGKKPKVKIMQKERKKMSRYMSKWLSWQVWRPCEDSLRDRKKSLMMKLKLMEMMEKDKMSLKKNPGK